MKRTALPLLVLASGLVYSLFAQTTDKTGAPWKTRLIARVGDAAPGGGTLESIGDVVVLRSGTVLFWGQFGPRDRKDWALYGYRDGNVALAFKAFEDIVTPDGLTNQFSYHSYAARNGYPPLNKASEHFLYLWSGMGGLGVNSRIYGYDGEKLTKILGEGDRLTIAGGREIVVGGVRLERITNDQRAIIHFVSEKPKVRGWVLHGPDGFTPLFNLGDDVPGMPGMTITGFHDAPVYEFLARDVNLFVFGDTLIARLNTDSRDVSTGIFRITPGGTEVLDSAKVGAFPTAWIVTAASANNMVLRSDDLYQYRNGKRIVILERSKTLSGKKGNPEIVRGRQAYAINNAVFLGRNYDEVVFAIKRNDNFVHDLYYFSNGTLTGIREILPQQDILRPYLLEVRQAPDRSAAYLDHVWRDNTGKVMLASPVVMTRNVTFEKGGVIFDPATRSLTTPSSLQTEGEGYFDASCIIAQTADSRLIAWNGDTLGRSALYELYR